MTKMRPEDLRSRQWFNNPDDPEMTALYLERYLNYGLTQQELQSNKPIIAIAQTGSDLSPCNRHHIELAKRVRDGIIAMGGIPMEVPVHPIQETGKRPTASLDRNLAYLSLVESLYGYPIDGVVLTIGCDKTTPALLMAAATVNIPAIALSVGPMLNGWFNGERAGSGTTIWNGPLPRARPDQLRDRPTHRRDGLGRPAPRRHHDARGLRECGCRELCHWRVNQRAHSPTCDCPAFRPGSGQ